MYLDAAYVAKYYLNEPDSPRVRKIIEGAGSLISSVWSIAEVSCVFHRYLGQGDPSAKQFQTLSGENGHRIGICGYCPGFPVRGKRMAADERR